MIDPQHEETFADTERKLREIITTLRECEARLRAQLAQERANALEAQQTWPIWALEIKDKLQSYGVDPGDEWNVAEQFEGWIDEVVSDESTRADRAEAALAAQIEVDAGIAMGHGVSWVHDKETPPGVAIARNIRNQPHDRTALDRHDAKTREKVLREAVDALRAHPASRCRDKDVSIWFQNAILALIEKPDAR